MKHFIVSKEPDSLGRIRLDKKDYNYLVSVRRLKKGQNLSVLLKNSKAVLTEVVEINTKKKYLELMILDESLAEEESSLNKLELDKRVEVILMQWLIKGQHMDLAVRQATEAGVSAIFSVMGEFSAVKKDSAGQFERRQRIIREARQQSGSFIDTQIFQSEPLEDCLERLKKYTENKKTVCFMLTEKRIENQANLLEALKEKPETVVLAIGCEGGISPGEEKILLKNNFQAVHFETNVLRAETAAIYSIASVQSVMQMM